MAELITNRDWLPALSVLDVDSLGAASNAANLPRSPLKISREFGKKSIATGAPNGASLSTKL
jgi:hypothetical protein